MNKKGFTLAEVLITLGIIGVVAALTLPTVISHHNKKVVETRLAKFYSVMNQAIQRSIVDNDEPEHWITDREILDGSDINYNKLYEKYIIPYLDGVSITDTSKRRIYSLKDGNAFSVNHGDLNPVWAYIVYGVNSDVLKDATGDPRSEKLSGRKIFYFSFPKVATAKHTLESPAIGIFPVGYEDFSNTNCAKPFPDDYRELMGCATVIMRNGWKIPDDYPIKF